MSCRSRSRTTSRLPEALAAAGAGAQRGVVHATLPVGVPGDGTTRLRVRADRLSRRSDRSRGTPALPRVVSPPSRIPRALRRADIYADVWRRCRPERLSVYARFTRRGGIDINPYRSSEGGVTAGPRAHGAAVTAGMRRGRRGPSGRMSLDFIRRRPCRRSPSRSPRGASSTRRCRSCARWASFRPKIRSRRAS